MSTGQEFWQSGGHAKTSTSQHLAARRIFKWSIHEPCSNLNAQNEALVSRIRDKMSLLSEVTLSGTHGSLFQVLHAKSHLMFSELTTSEPPIFYATSTCSALPALGEDFPFITLSSTSLAQRQDFPGRSHLTTSWELNCRLRSRGEELPKRQAQAGSWVPTPADGRRVASLQRPLQSGCHPFFFLLQ